MARAENLTVKYGETAVLDQFSADFPDGAVTAVSGRSGCGRTTLLAVLLGLLRPDAGAFSGFQTERRFQEDRLLPFLSAAGIRRGGGLHGGGGRGGALFGQL
ncbi:MAG: ATP-binding cassette domain-containing protein [Butyricicoccus sp.]